MSDETRDPDIFTVARLIGLRRPFECDDDCDEAVALASHGLAAPEEIERASLHLATCALCRESLLALSSFDALKRGGDAAEVAADDGAKPISSVFAKGRVILAAAALLIFGITAVLMLSHPWSKSPKEGEGLVVKGPPDRFQIAVQRGSVQFTAEPMDRLLEGDRLGLFYSADKAGHIAVIDIDDAGKAALLYPSGAAQSAPIAAGNAVPIPDGAVVRGGEGCEWVLAIFSDKPLDTARLLESLGRAKRNAGTCEFAVDIPHARQIRILPFKR